jgi:hypothetical protein
MPLTPDRTTRHFVIGCYGPEDYSLLQLDPYKSLVEAKRAIAWQGAGGFVTPFHIASPDPETRGTFVTTTGQRISVTERGGWTAAAWNAFLDREWPTAKAEG